MANRGAIAHSTHAQEHAACFAQDKAQLVMVAIPGPFALSTGSVPQSALDAERDAKSQRKTDNSTAAAAATDSSDAKASNSNSNSNSNSGLSLADGALWRDSSAR